MCKISPWEHVDKFSPWSTCNQMPSWSMRKNPSWSPYPFDATVTSPANNTLLLLQFLVPRLGMVPGKCITGMIKSHISDTFLIIMSVSNVFTDLCVFFLFQFDYVYFLLQFDLNLIEPKIIPVTLVLLRVAVLVLQELDIRHHFATAFSASKHILKG